MDYMKNYYRFIFRSRNKFFFTSIYLIIKFFIFKKMSFLEKKYNKLYHKKFGFKNDIKGTFSQDWFSYNIKYLVRILYKYSYINKTIKILEIGSFEGRSALFFLKTLNNSKITCVDTFQASEENYDKNFNHIYKNFKKNLEPYNERVSVFVGTSDLFFNQNKEIYDLIYIDGHHKYDYVLRDARNGFNCLKPGGIMIFDDFLWSYYSDINQNPIGAIKKFVSNNLFKLKIISINYQLIIMKI